jgi:hypothetical protein
MAAAVHTRTGWVVRVKRDKRERREDIISRVATTATVLRVLIIFSLPYNTFFSSVLIRNSLKLLAGNLM